jgi:hypothetical protein
MMSEKLNLGDECCCNPEISGLRKITLPDGSREGIMGLDSVMEDMYRQKKPVGSAIGPEIFERLKSLNYLALSYRPQYEAAFLAEYQHFLELKAKPSKTG